MQQFGFTRFYVKTNMLKTFHILRQCYFSQKLHLRYEKLKDVNECVCKFACINLSVEPFYMLKINALKFLRPSFIYFFNLPDQTFISLLFTQQWSNMDSVIGLQNLFLKTYLVYSGNDLWFILTFITQPLSRL